MSSHLLAEVAQSVDDVVIVDHGRLVRQSSLAELTERPIAGVRVRTPQADKLQRALAAEGTRAQLRSGDTVVAFDTTAESVGLVAAGTGVVIYELSVERLELEDVFLELTGTLNGGK
jgi:ABC-2 type transport system ATP-binding protein